uniref:Uncharacterized protein n=1 Tax=Rhipicephalus zambeziensis TaxID=60191 RepID=A0A224YJ41_9ACAR
MKNFYFLVTIAIIAVNLATGAGERNESTTAAKNRFRVANSTNECRIYCGKDWEEDCQNGCICYRRNGDEPFLCIDDKEANFYYHSRYQ